MYWDNERQATERLNGSLVCYDDVPVQVIEIDRGSAVVNRGNNVRDRLNLDDAEWNNFRTLPKLGFINTRKGLFNLSRNPRPTMRHGLTGENTNTVMYSLAKGTFFRHPEYNITSLFNEEFEAFAIRQQADYPSFDEAFEFVRETGEPLAISHKHALVKRGKSNIIYLQRDVDQVIGMIVGNDVFLHKQYRYCQEEIQQTFQINEIKEI